MSDAEGINEQDVLDARPAPLQRRYRTRDFSLTGVLTLLGICWLAGLACSSAYNALLGVTGGAKSGTRQIKRIDLGADKGEQPGLNTFKRVDLVELEDGLHMMAATQAILKMDYGKGLSELNQISVEGRKTDPGCDTLMSECLLSLKQSDKVVALAEQHMKSDPRDYAGWLWRAEANEQLKDYPKAVEDYKKALLLFPIYKQDLLTRMSPMYVDKIEEAILALIYRRIGASYERMGDFKQACENYDRAIRIAAPELTSSLASISNQAKIQDAQKHISQLNSAMDDRTEDSALLAMRAKAYKTVGKYDLALKDMTRAMERAKSKSATMFFERAGTYYLLKNYKEAAHDYRKVHAEDPLYELPHMRQKKYSMAILPVTMMKKSKALNRFDRAIEKNANDDLNYYDRGVLEMAFHEYEDGSNDLQQYISRKTGNKSLTVAKANIFLALCHGHEKRRSDYKSVLDKACQSYTDNKWWHSIMLYLADRGITDQVLLDAAEDNKPRTVQAHYFIGQKYSINGKKSKAKEHFLEAIADGIVPVDEYYLCKLALLPDSKKQAEHASP